MPSEAVLRVMVKPFLSTDTVDNLRRTGEAFVKAGQALSKLADALTPPPEGETVDSMTVHFPTD